MNAEGIIALSIGISSILVGIFLATAVLVWQMRMINDGIKEQNAELKAQSGRISEVEREQARLEGANGVLTEILNRQSHTHEPGDSA